DPDVCSGARAGTVDGAEMGDGEGAGFRGYEDGERVNFVFNDAGDATLPMVFRLTGSDVPACVEHRSSLTSCPADATCSPEERTTHVEIIAPLHTYPLEAGGGRETHTLFLRLERDNEPLLGAALFLTSTIAGIDLAVELSREA